MNLFFLYFIFMYLHFSHFRLRIILIHLLWFQDFVFKKSILCVNKFTKQLFRKSFFSLCCTSFVFNVYSSTEFVSLLSIFRSWFNNNFDVIHTYTVTNRTRNETHTICGNKMKRKKKCIFCTCTNIFTAFKIEKNGEKTTGKPNSTWTFSRTSRRECVTMIDANKLGIYFDRPHKMLLFIAMSANKQTEKYEPTTFL